MNRDALQTYMNAHPEDVRSLLETYGADSSNATPETLAAIYKDNGGVVADKLASFESNPLLPGNTTFKDELVSILEQLVSSSKTDNAQTQTDQQLAEQQKKDDQQFMKIIAVMIIILLIVIVIIKQIKK